MVVLIVALALIVAALALHGHVRVLVRWLPAIHGGH